MSAVAAPPTRRYAILLAAQTLCAVIMLFNIHASFRLLIENIGMPHLSMRLSVVQLLLAAALGQACYWYRLHRVALPAIRRNLPLGHLLAFASRIGFIFGSASTSRRSTWSGAAPCCSPSCSRSTATRSNWSVSARRCRRRPARKPASLGGSDHSRHAATTVGTISAKTWPRATMATSCPSPVTMEELVETVKVAMGWVY